MRGSDARSGELFSYVDLEDRVPEFDFGASRDGMVDKCFIEMLSTDPTLPPGFVRKIKSNRASPQIKELDPAQPGRRQAINLLADTQAIQDSPGAGIETISANFLSWKLGSFED